MKKTLALVTLVTLMGFVAANADSLGVQSSVVAGQKHTSRAPRQHTYITSVNATGSHLPLVVTRYGNDIYANSSFVAYSQPQLDQTGELNVGAELVRRDPAITFSRGIR